MGTHQFSAIIYVFMTIKEKIKFKKSRTTTR